MSVLPAPVYHSRKHHYRIDSCAPQLAALRQGQIELHALTHGHYPGIALAPEQLQGISSIGFLDGGKSQKWGSDPHRNEGLEISFLETGSMALTVDAKNFELQAGRFAVTRPWQLHKLGSPHIGRGRFHWLIIDVGIRRPNQQWRWPAWIFLTEKDREELARKLRHNENPVQDSSAEIVSAFRGLATGIQRWGEPRMESRVITLINQLLVGILTALDDPRPRRESSLASDRRVVENFLRALSENRARSGQPWTLKTMAHHCEMGITAFCGHTRDLVNNGPVEYLNQCRLEHAARQLRERPEMSVTEIAFHNGFNSSQYFATVFRKQFRYSPRDYRRTLDLA